MYIRRNFFNLLLVIGLVGCSDPSSDQVDDSPQPKITAPSTLTISPEENGTVNFNLTQQVSTTAIESPVYTWNFGDGSEQITTTTAYTQYDYSQPGEYDAFVIISDASNQATPVKIDISVSITTEVEIQNNDPIANFTLTADQLTVSLDSTSSDTDGDFLYYEWIVNGDTISTSKSFTHTFLTSGLKSIDLKVTDMHGANSSVTKTITLDNQPPLVNFSVTATEGMATFDASLTSDPENDELSFEWDFGNSLSAEGEIVTQTFNDGHYLVTLTVSDSFNTVLFEREVTITVEGNSAPVADFTFEIDFNNFRLVTFDASASFDIDADQITYYWDFGNGQTSTDKITSQTFEAGSENSVTLTVSDELLSAMKVQQVSIDNIIETETETQTETETETENFDDFIGNAQRGSVLFEEFKCESCHANFDPDLYKNNLHNLYNSIDTSMPLGNSALCEGQCAADITAYIDEVLLVEVASCNVEDPVLYGQRALRLLTNYEYKNTLNSLFMTQVPDEFSQSLGEVSIASFPNNYNAVVTGGVNDQYYTNAEAIADWAIAQDLPFACTEVETCVNQFINEFAEPAFRRPLKENETDTEISDFTALITNAPSLTVGLRWAMVTTLISPDFLYRSEQGILVSSVKENGWGLDITTGENSTNINDYIATSDATTVAGQDFETKSTGGAENEDGTGGHNIWTTGNISQTFNFTETAIINITLRGSLQDNIGPNMIVTAGDIVVVNTDIQNDEYHSVSYLVTGLTGEHALTIEFTNDVPPSATQDRNLYVLDATVSGAKLIEVPVVPEANPSTLELADDNAYVLDPFEYATALSYMYTGSMPDALLRTAAKSGDLESKDLVLAQIDRMMNSAAGEAHFKKFVTTWMQTDKLLNPTLTRDNPAFTDDVRQAMVGEVEAFFWHIFNNENIPFSDFYNADYTFVNSTLAQYYSMTGITGDDFVQTDTTQRGGIVTSGAFMTTFAHPDQSSPIIRAVRVRELMLCHHIDAPPALPSKREELAAQVEILKNNGDLTTRGYYEKITDDGVCADCHDEDINPLGGGMEDFDQAGLPRTSQLDVGFYEFDVAINATGSLIGTNKLKDTNEAPFYGAKELSNIIGGLESSQACLVEKAFRFSTGRAISPFAMDKISQADSELSDAEIEDFQCANDLLLGEFRDSNESPKALFRKMGVLDLIRFRR